MRSRWEKWVPKAITQGRKTLSGKAGFQAVHMDSLQRNVRNTLSIKTVRRNLAALEIMGLKFISYSFQLVICPGEEPTGPVIRKEKATAVAMGPIV